jgi:hypothetical protein
LLISRSGRFEAKESKKHNTSTNTNTNTNTFLQMSLYWVEWEHGVQGIDRSTKEEGPFLSNLHSGARAKGLIELEGAKELVRIVWNKASPRRCVAATVRSGSDDSIAMDWILMMRELAGGRRRTRILNSPALSMGRKRKFKGNDDQSKEALKEGRAGVF